MAKKADIHLRLRPGTDGALALGFLHLLIKDKQFDREFVEKWTVGFDKLVKAVSEFCPEKVASITGVPKQCIIDACRMFTREKPANFSPGIAIELQKSGFQTARAISILQAITGNIDIIGGARLNIQIPMAPVVLNRNDRGGKSPIGSDRFPLFYKINGRSQANIYSDVLLGEGAYPLKAMIVIGSNPILTWPNSNKLRRALKSLEFLVVMDHFLTETAKLADIVIPGLNYVERSEIWNGAIRFGEEKMGLSYRAIDNQQGYSECEFIAELAARLGHEDELPWQTAKFAGLFGMLDAGQIDTICHQIAINPEREKQYSFTEPYVNSNYQLVVKKDSELNTLEDFAGKNIGVVAGGQGDIMLQKVNTEKNLNIQIKGYDGTAAMDMDVDMGRLDARLGPAIQTRAAIKQKNLDLRVTDVVIFSETAAFPFKKDEKSEAIIKDVNAAIADMKADGSLSELSVKWFEVDATKN